MKISKLFFFLLTLFFTAGAALQYHLIFSGDVSWLLHVTQKLLNGGVYVNDFFETNPPLILYLYMPSIWLHQLFSLNLRLSFQLYMTLWILLSLLLSNYLLSQNKKISLQLRQVFLFAIVFISLFLPSSEFGQRDYLALLFTLPYLFLLTNKADQIDAPLLPTCLIAILGSIGFFIKPFFLIPPALIGIYLLIRTKHPFKTFRVELITFFTVALLLPISIVLFTPQYFTSLIPLITSVYYATVSFQWSYLLLYGPFGLIFFFCVLSGSFYLTQRKESDLKSLGDILALATLGFLASYLLQRTAWYYHIIPAFSCAILLTIVSLSSLRIHKKSVLALLSAFCLAIPIGVSMRMIQEGRMALSDPLFVQLKNKINQTKPNKTIYFLDVCYTDAYPLIDYTSAQKNVSRFPVLYWLTTAVAETNRLTPKKRQHIKTFLTNAVIQDLQKGQPDLLFVQDPTQQSDCLKNKKFNITRFFEKDTKFRTILKHYRATNHIDHFILYQRLHH
ncbi:MAG: hypothetical protein KKI20_01890 [Gammaproteobacteria bacterium]|nr:hypothetical protein [Gammaproteobacteria bacterium]